MFIRDNMEFKEAQKEHIHILIDEARDGITQRDVLPNTAQPLQGEVEAMYFNEINRFFENSISRRIMKRNQDLFEGKIWYGLYRINKNCRRE